MLQSIIYRETDDDNGDPGKLLRDFAVKISKIYKPKENSWPDFRPVFDSLSTLEKNIWRLSCMTRNGLTWLYEQYPEFPAGDFDATGNFEYFGPLDQDAFGEIGLSDGEVEDHIKTAKMRLSYFAHLIRSGKTPPLMSSFCESYLSPEDEVMMWRSYPDLIKRNYAACMAAYEPADRA